MHLYYGERGISNMRLGMIFVYMRRKKSGVARIVIMRQRTRSPMFS